MVSCIIGGIYGIERFIFKDGSVFMKMRKYNVRGLLRRGNRAKQFSYKIEASSIKVAESSVKAIVSNYCKTFYPNLDEVKCIINKKTVRCD